MNPAVYLQTLEAEHYLGPVRTGLEWIKFAGMLSADAHVFIKPNLTFPAYRPGVMTSPEALEAAIVAVRDFTSHITIGDSDSGGYNPFRMEEVYRATGIDQVARKYGVNIVNLSALPTRSIAVPTGRRTYDLNLPRLLLDEIDLLLTMPVPKIHMNTGVSLAFKNQWGCIPNPQDRLRLHPYFSRVIMAVNAAVKARVAIVDGRFGLNVSGPMRGEPVPLNWVMVANDIGAASQVACTLMQIDPMRIGHLRHAHRVGLLPALGDITLNAPLEQFTTAPFVLKRAWTDYPGFFAFHNAPLAYLAYFSPLASLLHRLLYLFREPFYDYDQGKDRR